MQVWQFKTKLQGLSRALLFAYNERKNKRSNAVCRATNDISSSGDGFQTYSDSKENKNKFNIQKIKHKI